MNARGGDGDVERRADEKERNDHEPVLQYAMVVDLEGAPATSLVRAQTLHFYACCTNHDTFAPQCLAALRNHLMVPPHRPTPLL